MRREPTPGRRSPSSRDIQPILTSAGCNSGPCHGKARGQNGFALSLLAFDPDGDYAALVHEGAGGGSSPRILPKASC
ncbi:MAG: hypothetical protein U0794_06180 [Isosphaeraceae bacterium]